MTSISSCQAHIHVASKRTLSSQFFFYIGSGFLSFFSPGPLSLSVYTHSHTHELCICICCLLDLSFRSLMHVSGLNLEMLSESGGIVEERSWQSKQSQPFISLYHRLINREGIMSPLASQVCSKNFIFQLYRD